MHPFIKLGRHAARWLALAALSLSGVAQAQILIGQTSGFTGAISLGVKENTEGAKLYFDHVNAHGGINGQRIELLSMDDQYDPKLAAQNARALCNRNVIALFLNRGTPHTQAMLPVLDEFKVPLVAPSTGAMLLHRPVHPYVFNVRATYQREAEKTITHLATVGLTRIAIFHVDDSFGSDAAAGALRGFEAAHLAPALVSKFDRSKPDFRISVKEAKDLQVQAIFVAGAAAAVADISKLVRESGSEAQIVTLSNNASGGFIKLMDKYARGTIVSQVFPSERAFGVPMVKEAHDLAVAKGMKEVTPAMLEGYAGAKVLVEGLRRAGNNPTRQSLTRALEGFNKVNIGGLEVSYGPNNHTGLDYADLSIISRSGQFLR